MNYRFQGNSNFALVAAHDAFTDLPDAPFRLSDGTWVMPRMPPTADLDIWKKWLGSIHLKRLSSANLVLLTEKPSDSPEVLEGVHRPLSDYLGLLFWVLHLHAGVETSVDDPADRLAGFCVNGNPRIKQVDQMLTFCSTLGQKGAPITRDLLEDSLVIYPQVARIKADKTQFRRVRYGLNVLFKGLREESVPDRIHQFVRSLEGLTLPEIGKTKKQFSSRCQTFISRPRDDVRNLLKEAFDLRSATEHLNAFEGHLEDVILQRTRQMERLSCHAYSRLLRDSDLLDEHFRTDKTIREFWQMKDDKRRTIWDTGFDIVQDGMTAGL